MKSLFRILFGKRLIQHPDSFALTRSVLWDSIAKSIQLQQSIGKTVWLVVHFPETYLQCQEMLEGHDISYQVETEKINEAWFLQTVGAPSSQTRLLLTDLMRPLKFESDPAFESEPKIAMMVVERHPHGPVNERLLRFAESIPCKVEVGHFLALDDEMVKQMVPAQMVDLLKTMGLGDNDLISSSMVTRIIKRRIGQTTDRVGADQIANSASEWLELQSASD